MLKSICGQWPYLVGSSPDLKIPDFVHVFQKNVSPEVLDLLSQFEAANSVRAAMPTELPQWIAAPVIKPPERVGSFRLTTQIAQGGPQHLIERLKPSSLGTLQVRAFNLDIAAERASACGAAKLAWLQWIATEKLNGVLADDKIDSHSIPRLMKLLQSCHVQFDPSAMRISQ